MQGMRQAKKFAVVVWVRKTDALKAVREQLVSLPKTNPTNRQNTKEWSTSIGGSKTLYLQPMQVK